MSTPGRPLALPGVAVALGENHPTPRSPFRLSQGPSTARRRRELYNLLRVHGAVDPSLAGERSVASMGPSLLLAVGAELEAQLSSLLALLDAWPADGSASVALD